MCQAHSIMAAPHLFLPRFLQELCHTWLSMAQPKRGTERERNKDTTLNKQRNKTPHRHKQILSSVHIFIRAIRCTECRVHPTIKHAARVSRVLLTHTNKARAHTDTHTPFAAATSHVSLCYPVRAVVQNTMKQPVSSQPCYEQNARMFGQTQ
jgi:hypothetical protein